MIFASLESSHVVAFLRRHPVWDKALDAVGQLRADSPVGIEEFDGERFYLNVHGYDTQPVASCAWENHRHTLDLQICLDGGEGIDWLPASAMSPGAQYVPEKDTEKFPPPPVGARPARLPMRPGNFAIFLPGDAHMPKIADGTHPAVHKAVVKIDTQLLGDWL